MRLLGRPSHGWGDNFVSKMDLKEIVYERVQDLLTEDRDQCPALVNTVMNLSFISF